MTAIAALSVGDLVYMGGDSSAVEASHYLDLAAAPKVFELGPLVIGFTSSFRMGQALQHRLVLPERSPDVLAEDELDRWMAVDFMDAVRHAMSAAGYLKIENSRQSGGQFLCGIRGAIYYCDDDFHARRSLRPYAAVGSGTSACMGALFMASRVTPAIDAATVVEIALHAAEACIATVRGPFNVVTGGRRYV